MWQYRRMVASERPNSQLASLGVMYVGYEMLLEGCVGSMCLPMLMVRTSWPCYTDSGSVSRVFSKIMAIMTIMAIMACMAIV